MTAERDTAMWLMPHWTKDFRRSRCHLEAAVGAVFDQTDRDWELVVVDDGSDDPAALAYLRALSDRYPRQVHEGQHELAREQVRTARAVSAEATERRLAARRLNDQPWART